MAAAQFNPGPAEYYYQCRTLYTKHVLTGAAAACELSLTANSDYVPALKLLARIYLDEKRVDEAGDLIDHLSKLAPDDLETRTLSARFLLVKGRYRQALEMSRHVPGAEASLIRGRALEKLGRFNEALAAYREAALLGREEGRVYAAELLERMHRPSEALEELGDLEGPELAPLKGRLLLSAGRLPEAAATLEEALKELPSSDERYAEALRTLAISYYGMGKIGKGNLVLSQLGGSSDLVGGLLRASWLWLFGALLLAALHLYGESRIEPISTLEVREDYTWGVGRLYAVFALSWLVGGAVALLAGWWLYHNLLAAFTPVQADLVRPLFFLSAAATMALATLTVLRHTPEEAPPPLGKRENWIEGLWVGTLLALLVVGFAWLRPRLPWLHPLPFNPLLYSGALAVAGMALAEPLLRVVAPTVFRVRYGAGLAPLFAILTGGLVWLSPLVLWWSAAAFLYWVRHRFAGIWPNMAGWLTAALILLLVGFLPSIRALF